MDRFLKSEVKCYRKLTSETDGFSNPDLVSDVKGHNLDHLIVMGQSVNACCAATARGAVKALPGLKIHTSKLIVRGGKAATETPLSLAFNGISGWPDSTTCYAKI